MSKKEKKPTAPEDATQEEILEPVTAPEDPAVGPDDPIGPPSGVGKRNNK